MPVDELNRGITDYFAGEYSVALTAFDRYFQTGAADEPTARYYNRLTLRALGGFNEAIQQWDIIIQNYPEDRYWDAAWYQKAYTQWYYQLDHFSAIQTLTDFVTAAPVHPRAGEFLFDAAEIAEQFADLEQAALLWERVANEYPAYEEAQRAIFLAGITRYRQEQYADALTIFQRALASKRARRSRRAQALCNSEKSTSLIPGRATHTKSQPGATMSHSRRTASLMRRRARFRSTAPPIHRLTVKHTD